MLAARKMEARVDIGDNGTAGLTVRRTSPEFNVTSPDFRGTFLGAGEGGYRVRLRERCIELVYDNLERLRADWELD